MPDPLQRGNDDDAPLFAKPQPSEPHSLYDGTRPAGQHPGLESARNAQYFRDRILRRLRVSDACLFEVAAGLGVPDHIISGRFTELSRDGLIERTGDTRRKPESGCACAVWRIRKQPERQAQDDR
jgi:hypothetical protein